MTQLIRRLKVADVFRIAVLVALASSAPAVSMSLQEDFDVADRIESGVILPAVFSDDSGLMFWGEAWNHSELSVSEGEDSVTWNLTRDGWGQGTWSAVALEPQDLGETRVRPMIVDWSGDNRMSLGDYVVLTAVNGTALHEDVEYTMTITNRIPSDTGGFWDSTTTTTTIIFTMTCDGALDYTGQKTVRSFFLYPVGSDSILQEVIILIVAVATVFLTVYLLLLRAFMKRRRRTLDKR